MADLKGTNVYAPIVPGTDEDTYPTHDSRYGKGGYREVATLSDRDSIPVDRLKNGCKVYVEEDDIEYRYRNGKWIPLTPLLFDITTLEDYNAVNPKSQNTLYMCKEGNSITKLFIGSIPILLGGSGSDAPVAMLLDSGILDRDYLSDYSDDIVLILDKSRLDINKLI